MKKPLKPFDYKQAKLDAEKMLKVIERDPQSSWINDFKSLTPWLQSFYSLAIMSESISVMSKSLKEAKVI